MFEKVAVTMYPVTDVPRTQDFYEATLGLKIGSHGETEERLTLRVGFPAPGDPRHARALLQGYSL